MNRKRPKKLTLGKVIVGGGAPITIQSMTNTDTCNIPATLAQINELAKLGCELIRVAVPDQRAAEMLKDIVEDSPIPVIADIHFDYQLAMIAMDNGVCGIRLNPGNIDHEDHIKKIAEKAGERNVVIRVGANSGSIRPALMAKMLKDGHSRPKAIIQSLIHSALAECAMLEKYNFNNIKVSLKSSSVPITVAACRKFASEYTYPQHIGITEAGTPARGIIKSAVGIGALLLDGIGETMRVSLTADPMEEVIVARRILESCGIREALPEIISCPTCGRTEIDLIGLTNRVENYVSQLKADGNIINLRKIAVMGCPVNGPGEAKDADLGLAGGKKQVVVFKLGEVVGTFDPEEGFEYLKVEILKNTTKEKVFARR